TVRMPSSASASARCGPTPLTYCTDAWRSTASNHPTGGDRPGSSGPLPIGLFNAEDAERRGERRERMSKLESRRLGYEDATKHLEAYRVYPSSVLCALCAPPRSLR